MSLILAAASRKVMNYDHSHTHTHLHTVRSLSREKRNCHSSFHRNSWRSCRKNCQRKLSGGQRALARLFVRNCTTEEQRKRVSSRERKRETSKLQTFSHCFSQCVSVSVFTKHCSLKTVQDCKRKSEICERVRQALRRLQTSAEIALHQIETEKSLLYCKGTTGRSS